MKIGIVCYPSIGGSGVIATNLGLELAAMGHQIHFISYEEPFKLVNHAKKNNIHFHRVTVNEYQLFKYPDYTLPLAVKIDEVDKKHKLDILHVHYAVPHATAAILARKIAKQQNRKVPHVITTLHGTDISLLANDPNLTSIIKYSIENSCGVTAVSESLKKETIATLKTKIPIDVIYNFYTPKIPTRSRESVRRQLKIKADDFLAIHISNLRSVKRIPDLLKAIAQTKNSKIKLLVIAGGDFKEFRPLVKRLNIQNKIIIKDEIFEPGDYINAADVGLYTSEKESFGLGILETLAYGKPVVAANIGGIPEVMQNGKHGYLLPVGDITGFAKKINLLENNRELSQRLGEQGWTWAKKNFSTHKIVQQYLDYYNKVQILCRKKTARATIILIA